MTNLPWRASLSALLVLSPLGGLAHQPAGPEGQVSLSQYQVSLQFHPQDHLLIGQATFTLQNNSSQPATEVTLYLHSELRFARVVDEEGHELSLAQSIGPYAFNYSRRATQARLTLPDTLRPGAALPLRAFYFGKLSPEKGTPGLGISPRQVYLRGLGFTLWLPTLAASLHEIVTATSPVTLDIGVPRGLRVVAVGELEKSWQEENHRYSRWASPHPLPLADLAIVAGSYREERVEGPGVGVRIWTLSAHARSTKRWVKEVTQDLVRTLVQEMGLPLPYRSLTLIELPAGADLLAENLIGVSRSRWPKGRTDLEPLAQLVANQLTRLALVPGLYPEPGVALLAAGLPTYLALLLLEESLGENWAFARVGGRLRQQYLQLRSKLKDAEVPGSDSTEEPALARLGPAEITADPGKWLVETRGVWVMHMLRYLMGEARFAEFLQFYARTYRLSTMTYEEFGQLAERYYGADLSWFFRQWVEGTGLPEYRVTGARARLGEEGYTLEFHLTNAGQGRMPLPVEIVTEGGRERYTFWLGDGEERRLKVRVRGRPQAVELDPQGWILQQNSVTRWPVDLEGSTPP